MAGKGGEGAGVGQHAHRARQEPRFHQLVDLLRDTADVVKEPPSRAVLHLRPIGGEVHRHGGEHGTVGGVEVIEDGLGQGVATIQVTQEGAQLERIGSKANTVAACVCTEGRDQAGGVVADRAEMELHGEIAAVVLPC